jgi:hypothetical protein
MRLRLGLLALAAVLLAGCNTINCGENSRNSSVSGGCGAHTTF